MKLTTGILAIAMMTGGAWAQNQGAINNARNMASSLQAKQANGGNAGQAAKPAPGAPAPAVKPVVIPAAKPASAPKPAPVPAPVSQSASKPVSVNSAAQGPATKKKTPEAAKVAITVKAPGKPAPKPQQAKGTQLAPPSAPPAPANAKAEPPKPADRKWAMTGKRDPFFSPVVQQPTGSGCSSGKKCLEIGQINLRGVVKSESGFIAVVTNSLNKAYFLRENDPVFNGYVVKITGDSVVFQETVEDKLGKPFTREVVKRIFTPAV